MISPSLPRCRFHERLFIKSLKVNQSWYTLSWRPFQISKIIVLQTSTSMPSNSDDCTITQILWRQQPIPPLPMEKGSFEIGCAPSNFPIWRDWHLMCAFHLTFAAQQSTRRGLFHSHHLLDEALFSIRREKESLENILICTCMAQITFDYSNQNAQHDQITFSNCYPTLQCILNR